jgi:hypothetical protein
MSERNPKRFETVTSAQSRSPEEQQRLLEEADRERYEAFMSDGEADYDKAMADREVQAYDEHAETEKRVMEDVDTRRMYMEAQQIAELRDSGAEPEIIADKEELLQELLLTYTDKAYADRDAEVRNAEVNATSTVKGKAREEEEKRQAEANLAPKIQAADFILNSTDSAWVSEKLAVSGTDKVTDEASDKDLDKDRVKDSEEARALANVEAIARHAESHPEVLDDPEFVAKLRRIMGEIDTALASAKESDEGVKEPKDVDLSDDEVKEPKGIDIDDEEVKTPGDIDLADDEEVKTPKDIDLGDDDEEVKTPKGIDDLSDHEEATDEEADTGEKVSKWRRPDLAVYAYFASGRARERWGSSSKGKVAAVIGGVAIIGGLIAARHYGWFGGGGGNSHGDAVQDFTPGQKGGHPGGTGIETPPVVQKGPEIPNGSGYEHPWNWMTAAIENGSVKPPAGMSAEQALHHYGDLAEKAGYKVEWHNLPNGLESVSINGDDSTEAIAKVISQVAK